MPWASFSMLDGPGGTGPELMKAYSWELKLNNSIAQLPKEVILIKYIYLNQLPDNYAIN